MRRVGLLLSLIVVVLFGTLALHVSPVTLAQEATPAGEEMEGITFEPVTFALGVDLMSPSDFFVARIGVDPGAAFPIDATDPTTGILLVESGAFTVQVEGPVSVTRGAEMGEAMAAAEDTADISTFMESVAAGEAVTLEAGDAAYIPANVAGEIRNEGQERAVGLAFLVVPPEGMTGEATPAP
jgi:quercetin dioxygenase-like cupin family protein